MKLNIKKSALCFFSILSFLVFIYILFSPVKTSYSTIWLLPLAFAILSIPLINGLSRIDFLPFVIIFLLINFTRYVVLPFLMVYCNYYEFRSPIPPDLKTILESEFLMIYELIAISLFLFFRTKYFGEVKENYKNKRIQKKSFYYFYIVICFSYIVIIPTVRNNINFIFPRQTLESEISPFYLILILAVILAKNLVYSLCLDYISKKNIHPFIRFMIIIIAVAINSSIYYGLNRSDFILNFIASLYIVYCLYPKMIKKIIVLCVILIIPTFSLITSSRQIYKISESNQIINLIDTAQAYSGSLYNVAISIEATDMYESEHKISILVNDFLRPTMGFNILMKQFDLPLSNEIFNERMYMTHNRVTQIMPMIGQGYFYFGFIFSPVLEIVFLELALRLIAYLNRLTIEAKYIFSITCTRLGFIVGQNVQIQMNDLSFNLFLFIIIWWINKKIKIRW